MRLRDFTMTIQKGKNNPRTQKVHQNPAFCQIITLACLRTALRPCLANALPVWQRHGWRVPSPTPATSACTARHRAHMKGQFPLGCYWWNGPSPITQPRASSVPCRSAREMWCVLVPQAGEHPSHRKAGPLPASLRRNSCWLQQLGDFPFRSLLLKPPLHTAIPSSVC